MWTDNSEPGRYVMQPSTPEEQDFLDLLASVLEVHERVKRVYWTHDVPEYPGLSRLAWHEASMDDPASGALVIDYGGGE